MNKSTNLIITLNHRRNACIAIIIMLILILTLQSPVCCDDINTSSLELPPIHEQLSTSMQLLPTSSNLSEAPVRNADTAAVHIEPGTDVIEAVSISPPRNDASNHETSTSDPVQLASLTEVAPSAASGSEIDERIKSDAANTLGNVNRSAYSKIAKSGGQLADDANSWECVEDSTSRLTWEVKKNDGNVRDRDHSYSWLIEIDGVKNGIRDGGRCKGGVDCDTSSYARAMNKRKLCGYTDWRLPTKAELETLVEYNGNTRHATINRTYFPEAVPSWYWTATEHPRRDGYAWYVLFRNGVALNDLKERPKHIRLVRGEMQQQ